MPLNGSRMVGGSQRFGFQFCSFPSFPCPHGSAAYRGEFHDAIREDGHCFTDLVRIRPGFFCHAETFARSLLVLVLATAPAAYLIDRTTGRAATALEMVLVFASAGWPVLLVLLIERQRRKRLRGQ